MTPTRPAPLLRGARVLALAAALAVAQPAAAGDPAAPPAAAGEGWKDEFAAVCAKTQDAMALPDAELRSLVERCDRLKPAIEELDEPLRKVYGRRLQACRELYRFVLDSRVKEAAR